MEGVSNSIGIDDSCKKRMQDHFAIEDFTEIVLL